MNTFRMTRHWLGVLFFVGMLSPENRTFSQSPRRLAQVSEGGATTKALNEGDWPQFRGPAGNGISNNKGLPISWSATKNIAWKSELPGAGASCPIVVGDRVFVTCYSGYGIPDLGGGKMKNLTRHVVCLSRDGGKILWTRDWPARLPEEPQQREDHFASSTPAADTDQIYIFFGKSGVFSLTLDGRPLWQADVGANAADWGSAASPVLHGNLVIVNASVESESLVALDRKTGHEVWRATGIREAWNTPVLVTVDGDRTELVVAVVGKLLGFDPSTGEQLWSCDTDIAWYMVPSVVADKGLIYCIGGRSGGALSVRAGGRGDVTQTHRLWTGHKGSNVSSPVYYNGHLFWMDDNLGIAYCADAESGQVVYQERIDRAGIVYASPVLADGNLYYVTRAGRSLVIAAKPSFEQIAANDALDTSRFNAGPAISNGQLLLRSDRFLYCIGIE